MAISQSRYVNITSTVAGQDLVTERELIARFFSTNPLVPPTFPLEFRSAEEVSDYFGAEADETLRSNYYFGVVTKNATSPQKISFAYWVDGDTPPKIFGGTLTNTLAELKTITAGSFILTMGGFTFTLSGIDFSAAADFTAIAAILETEVRAETGGGAMWTTADVSYVSPPGRFNLIGGSTGSLSNPILVEAAPSNDISTQLKWLAGSLFPVGPVYTSGGTEQTITETLDASVSQSNNFGTFNFVDSITQNQILEASTWNNEQGITYQYHTGVTAANAEAISEDVIGLGGTGLTLSPLTPQFPYILPMAIIAATDYDGVNTVQNVEFYQSDVLTPSVFTDADADTYDGLRVNYIGQTQSAGQFINFYQTGELCGDSAQDATDMNVYANEMWFKSAVEAAILNTLLASTEVPANNQGRIQILSVVQSVINQALRNGTISTGSFLTATQQAAITAITGDSKAWYQVQTNGYWVNCVIREILGSDPIEYEAVYTLVYKKNDVIRKVEGSQILI